MLSERGEIDPLFEDRLKKFVADRHLLVHKWLQERGIPETEGEWLELANFAIDVAKEANSLTYVLLAYVLKYAEPEWATSNSDEHREKMAAIFRGAYQESQG